jgi:transcriptional regulator with XRE-family HTH domain
MDLVVADVLLLGAVESLKHARKSRGVSLAQLAERTGLHRVSIARAERIGVAASVATVRAIATALDIPICALLDERIPHVHEG